MKRTFYCALILSFIVIYALSAQSTNPVSSFRNLNRAAREALSRGEIVFRQPTGWRDLSIPLTSPFYKETEETIRKENHNYIGEVIVVMTRAEATEKLPQLTARLLNFEGYAGIPYWSERNERQYDLFDWIKVTDGNRAAQAGWVKTTQFMLPFGEYSSNYEWNFLADRLTYAGINTTPLSYKGVRAVSPGNMIWRFSAYYEGDYCILYGLGAVKAFDLFGALKERLSASFMGRIEAFFRYVYSNY